MGLFSRFWKKKSAEGSPIPGPWYTSDGWISSTAGRAWNWWQMGYSPQGYSDSNAMVEACVSAYASTVAMCPGDHWRKLENGGRTRVETSSLSRILRQPNDYQSISDFLLNLTRAMYSRGEAFAIAIRNNRGEISELHLMRQGMAVVAVDGSIFYNLWGNEIVERRYDLSAPIPARDVLHVRLHTPHHPLKGVSPILAAALDLALSGAALNQQIAFYLNQARPSFILETDERLTKEQSNELRQRWDEQTQGENAGRTPILGFSIKAKPVEPVRDGNLAEMLKLSDRNVALAFRVPLQVLGVEGSTFASAEMLMQSWKASGLGFCLNHIEEAFGQLFRLDGVPNEYLEFDTKALLRSNFKDHMEGVARAAISGIYAPDEARAEFDLPAVEDGYGSMPRVQQQVVPLSYGANLQPPEPQVQATDSNDSPDDTAGAAQEDIQNGIIYSDLSWRINTKINTEKVAA